jgi:amino acid adenylation domain-containing protein
LLREKARQSKSVCALTHGQKALWFLHQSDPSSSAYNAAFAVRVRSPIDSDAVRSAFQALLDRHPSLRTTFTAKDGEPVAETRGGQELAFEHHDADGWGWDELRTRVADDYRRPFDLERGPLFRVSLFRSQPDDHVILITIHHIVCDAWSIWVLVHDFHVLYPALIRGAANPLPPAPPPYRDFVNRQAELLSGQEGDRLNRYWMEQLSGASMVLELPTDHPRPPLLVQRGASHFLRFDAELVERLEAVARNQGTTLYTVLLAAFQLLLHRYSGQDDLLVGTPVAGRTQAGFSSTVGYFTNTLVIRANMAGNPRFDALLGQVRQTLLTALHHQDYPFPLLVERLQPIRDPSRAPVAQVMFVMQKPPRSEEFWDLSARGSDQRIDWGGLDVEPFALAQMEGQFELTMELVQAGESLDGVIKFSTDLYDRATIARMEEHFRTILLAIAASPDRRIAELPILPASEERRVTHGWNQTRRPLTSPLLLHEWFEEQADRSPDAEAVVAPDDERPSAIRSLTYRELNERANQMAHRLRALGVVPDVPVGLCVDRSCEMMVGLFAILKAGGAYVPFDPAYPADRLRYMAEDSRVPVVLTLLHLGGLLAERRDPTGGGSPAVICLDTDWPSVATGPRANPRVDVSPLNLAYVIYTSGSTGKPKGAMNTHLGICNRLRWMQDALGLGDDDRVLQKTPLSFDVSVWELFWPILVGARLVIARPGGHQDQHYLADVIERQQITTLHFVPSMLALFLECPGLERCRRLRRVISSGEALPVELQRRFFARSTAELWNLYGPTEAAVDVTCWKCLPDDARHRIPIGRPIFNTQILILDRSLRPVPIGLPGELHIGGIGLARGYFDRPALTAEKFIPNPFSDVPGDRLYKTGDLARFLPDGNIEYLHRLDNQVKVRGCRVEPGEIEAVLRHHSDVREVAVAVQDRGGNDPQLVAYLVPRGDQSPSVAELRAHLSARLPEFMVPSAFVVLEALPLSPSGKVDCRSLPQLGRRLDPSQDARVPPRSEVERRVAAIWREVLGVDEVGVHDNFFELGGHSLLLARVRNLLQEKFGQLLTLVEMFQHPTVSALAGRLKGEESRQPSLSRADAGNNDAPEQSDAIAIIGMAGRFPGARDVVSFWSNLCSGVESIRVFSVEELRAAGVDPGLIHDPAYVPARGVLEGADGFDAEFFAYTPREAELMDVQHRVFLECAWAALEDAGRDPLAGDCIVGLFAGAGMNGYFINNLQPHRDLHRSVGSYQLMIGNDKDYLTTRTSYKLNLRGPSVSVQTACSTSLTAVHLACRSLLDGECEMALAGGVSISVPLTAGYLWQQDMILSPDGHCRAFDASARGTVGGSGVGVVVLKRLSVALADGDPVRAVIRGTAINNDGSLKAGYTAPSLQGQAAVIAAALEAARLSPDSIGYIEAHGTGTPLGDPVEIGALNQVFRNGSVRTDRCAIGSVKTNIGHLDTAAGIAGLIKTALALQHRKLPPSLHFETPNPEIAFESGPFYVNTAPADWPASGGPRRAGVSSFGIGGTNAHVILEEPPDRIESSPGRPSQVLVVSAKSPKALNEAASSLGEFLSSHPDQNLADVAYTLGIGRSAFRHRRVLVCRTPHEAAQWLGALDAARVSTSTVEQVERPVIFMFPGQGVRCVNVVAGLQHERVFRETLDRCGELVASCVGFDLREILFPGPERAAAAEVQLEQTAVAQPALFALEYALASLWMSWGVRPHAMTGHSLGEYAAACVAGVFSLEDALALVSERGKLLQSLPDGAMIAIPLPESEVREYLNERLDLAAVNGPRQCVASGTREDIGSLRSRLAAQKIDCHLLQTSRAFHSYMVDPVLERFAAQVAKTTLNPPSTPFISNVTGRWITTAQATDPSYWAEHMRRTVRFADGLRTLCDHQGSILLEVGPATTLSTLARQAYRDGPEMKVLSSLGRPADGEPDAVGLAEAVGQVWICGGRLDWSRYYAHERRQRVSLPTYPFQHQRFWVDPPVEGASLDVVRNHPAGQSISDWFFVPSWERSLPPDGQPEAGSHWLIFADPCGLGSAIVKQLRCSGVRVSVVQKGTGYSRLNEDAYTLAPASPMNYVDLFRELRESGKTPQAIVHLWNISPETSTGASEATSSSARDLSFYSLLFLAQSLGDQKRAGPCTIVVVSNHLHDVCGSECLDPAKALLLGPVSVIPQEYSTLRCISIDVDLTARDGHRTLLVDRLVAETASTGSDTVVAYRGGHRWVQTLVRAPQDGKKRRLRDKGVYLITGGTGGLGLELAGWLARHAPGCKLALVSRSGRMGRGELEEHSVRGDAERRPASERCSSERIRAVDPMENGHWLAEMEAAIEVRFPSTGIAASEGFQGTLDRLCALYVGEYFRTSGIDLKPGRSYSLGQLRRELGILPKFNKFLSMFVRVLSEEGILTEDTGRVVVERAPWPFEAVEAASREARARFPELAGVDDLLRHCVRNYGPALSGDIEAISVLYPEGELDLRGAEAFYAENSGQRTLYMEIVGEIATQAVRHKSGGKVRILEVGGGAGTMTLTLMSRLRDAQVEYWFTDIGKSFVLKAERRAQELGFDSMRFSVLDISRDVVAQGFEPGGFDLVVGLDVVHATPHVRATVRNLKSLLAPQGLLCLLETVKSQRHVDMIWGLAEGWWYFEDDDLRRHSPLLSIPQWIEILRAAGFSDVEAAPTEHAARADAEFGLVVARNRDSTSESLAPLRVCPRADEPLERRGLTARRLEHLEGLGADVLVLQADVADPPQLRSVLAQVRERFGDLHGVIHAAGIAGGGTIQLKTREDAEGELASKVDGSLALESVLKRTTLDFFVQCSSLTSFTGGFGQVAYSASCAFQDAWAQARASCRGDELTVSINWDRWRNIGMAAVLEARHRELIGQELTGGMSAAEGVEAFGRILSSASGPRVVVSTRDFRTLVRQSRTFQLGVVAAQRVPLALHGRPGLASDYIAPADETERLIADIWQEELGIERVGAQDDFFALGGDSLLAIKLVSRLRQSLGVALNVRTFYDRPTIAALSEHVASIHWAAQADSTAIGEGEEGGVL